MDKASCLTLISFLIFSFFMAEIHGRNQGEVFDKFQKSKYIVDSQIDRSDFNAQEVVVDYHIVHSHKGLKEKDMIDKLPGQPHVNFSQYGGYVTVDKLAGRALYYYFVESQHSKEKMPLLLWLNGGPGCSSLAYGAMEELGPFRVNSDGKTLTKNRYSWNYAANVLFLESPGGVGFSYSNKSSDYDTSGDRKTATDNYIFLVNWFERFPEYKKRDFYIAGESYAGHYVPQLAHTILHNNKKANKSKINLKGIMIGNAVINDETDNRGTYDYLASHAIISDQAANDINTFCNFSSNVNPIQCQTAINEYDRDVSFIDSYNIYAPLCNNFDLTALPKNNSWYGVVPVTSTKYSIKKMNLSTETSWYPWFFNGEVGGYVEVYKGGLTFATVREAGHKVPSFQPGRALSLIMHFLKGTLLPTTKRQV
ncbi:putative carboxypeptidase D [Lupinus albus]|uniref:Carboxypeptidase n=1 Tax=Lupinus albus TaxID=3870 RepID=A0A6A4P9C4_LUPAL|nr:putative carboxypeptidase D [Lupinus albus]